MNLIKAVCTLVARYTIYRSKADFVAGNINYRSIYFQLSAALELQEPDLSNRVRKLSSYRVHCQPPTTVSDFIIRDSLNQFAALLPGSTDVRKLIKDMFRNSYQSMINVSDLLLSEKLKREHRTSDFLTSQL